MIIHPPPPHSNQNNTMYMISTQELLNESCLIMDNDCTQKSVVALEKRQLTRGTVLSLVYLLHLCTIMLFTNVGN